MDDLQHVPYILLNFTFQVIYIFKYCLKCHYSSDLNHLLILRAKKTDLCMRSAFQIQFSQVTIKVTRERPVTMLSDQYRLLLLSFLQQLSWHHQRSSLFFHCRISRYLNQHNLLP